MGRRRERRKGRRGQRQDSAQQSAVAKMVQPLHKIPVYELMSDEAVEKIVDVSFQILTEMGIAFLDDPEAIDVLRANGVKVDDDQMAYFDKDVIMEFVSKAPSQFTQIARNPNNHVTIGANHICFAPVYGPPFVLDRERGRREAKMADFDNFVKMAYMTPYMHHSGGTVVEPTDKPVETRHLDMVMSHILHSDKAFMGSVTSAENAADSVELARILYGAEAIDQNPALISLINVSSPRRFDDRMLGAMKVYARANQAMIVTPFIMSGAMSPVSVAGTLAQMNAETLAGIAFVQMIRPGCPVVYGSFQTNIDLQSGAPVFGSPSSQMALFSSAQMARYYNLPFRGGGMFASSKIPDAQAAYESVQMMLPAVQARTNFVLHAAGWLENGLVAGYEKFIMDCELLGMYHRLMNGMDFSEDAFAIDSLRTVEPGGHHLGTDHTMRHFRTAFFRSDLFDYNPAEQWVIDGSQDVYERANAKYKQVLKQYEKPALDAGVAEALHDFVARRKAELAVSR